MRNIFWLFFGGLLAPRKGRRDGGILWFSPRTGGWDVVTA